MYSANRILDRLRDGHSHMGGYTIVKEYLRLMKLRIYMPGFAPPPKTGAELRIEVISRRYDRSATLVIGNLPSKEWTEAFGSERLTGVLLDRLTTTPTSCR